MPEKRPRITQKHIAEAAGVSKSAVSLALRNHPSLPRVTRERIRRLADRMGYYPDPALSALMGYRHGHRTPALEILGWITNWPTQDGWKHESPVYAHYFEGARARARELGYRLEHFWVREPGMSRSRFEQVLDARNIRGLILAPQPAPDARLDLDWSRYAAVKIGYTLKAPPLHTVTCSHFNSMKIVMKKLRGLGYRRIGFALQNTVDARVEHAWLGAYLLDRELDGDGPPIPPLLFRGAQRDRFQGWFDDHRPDAVVTAEPGFAATLIDWCGRLNLKVPNDIGVAVVSNVPLEGRFSGINEGSEQIGKTAVDVLARLLYRNETGISDTPQRILIDGTWVPGQTLRRPGKKR